MNFKIIWYFIERKAVHVGGCERKARSKFP